MSQSKNIMRRYPRLTRSGLLITFALGADQVAKTFSVTGNKGGLVEGSDDFFSLMQFFKPVQATPQKNEYNTVSAAAYDMVESNRMSGTDKLQDDIIEMNRRILAEEAEDPNKLPDDLRTLTSYPEPYLSKDQVKNGGFLLYVAGKSIIS